MAPSRRRRGRSRRGPRSVDTRAEWLIIDDQQGQPLVESPPPVAEQVRYMVERLRLQEADGLPAKIGVTSAVGDEGASLVARTLAGVLAGDSDRKVCLAGLDWWAIDAAQSDQAGMAQVVTGEFDLRMVLQRTSNERLTYLPAGPVDPFVLPELVRSSSLSRVLKELGLRVNNLVLELPPIHVTSEALALAGQCDACVLVVLQGSTSRSDVRTAMDHLGEDRVLGVILNQASSKVPDAVLRALGQS
jgi:protein-tyrosine kinase